MRAAEFLVLFGVLAAPGCIFIGARDTVRHNLAQYEATADRNAAARSDDFETALAGDEALLAFGGTDAEKVREERKQHFRQLVGTRLAKLGPLADSNAEAIVGQLVALRREARRALPASGSGGAAANASKLRQQDLAAVDAEVIAPPLEAAIRRLRQVIDAAAGRGELARAVALLQALADEFGPVDDRVSQIAALKQRIAATHLALAQQADADLPGARVLHASLAAIYGVDVGALREPGPVLLAETAQNWAILAPGTCGDLPADAKRTPATLAARLRSAGLRAGLGQMLNLTVSFTSCPLSKRTLETTEHVKFKQMEPQKVEELEKGKCDASTQQVHRKPEKYQPSKLAEEGEYWCDDKYMGKYRVGSRLIEVEKDEAYTVHHLFHKMSATGSIQIQFDAGMREATFNLAVESDVDKAWRAVHKESKLWDGNGEFQARNRMFDEVLNKINVLRDQVLATRAAVYTAKATASAAQGHALAADHNFYVADRIVQGGAKSIRRSANGSNANTVC